MEAHFITLTFQEADSRYGLNANLLRTLLDVGLLRAAPTPDTVLVDEPDELSRLARLHHDLDLTPEALDIILALRRRLVQVQDHLARETARTRQLERFLHGVGPLEDL